METMNFDSSLLPSPSFDTLTDPNMFFDFNAFPESAPETSANASIPRTHESTSQINDCSSLFGDMESLELPPLEETMLTLPEGKPMQSIQPSLTLVLPADLAAATSTEDKDDCSRGDFDAFHANHSAPAAPPPEPKGIAPQDVFSLPLESWPTDEIESFNWAPLDLLTNQDFFTESPDLLANINEAFVPNETELTLQTNMNIPLFPDFPSIASGEIPFTFDEEATSIYALPPTVSLTSPQSVTPQHQEILPANNTALLQHPRPITPALPTFIHETSPFCADLAPSSIIDAQGFIKATPVPPTTLASGASRRDLATPVVNGKVLKRIPRPAKAKDVNAADWYDTLPSAPSPWGGPDPVNNPIFQYNAHGEWLPCQRFSRDEILYYLTERKRLSLPLTLWIQNLPHGCVKRVTDGRTLKCRWDGCPAQNGTILKGFWRVCFDERPATSGKQHNPFHNAGYMHLWCLDRCFDLYEISQAFDLRPDTRHFEKEERNPMAMTRDHDELVVEYEDWRAEQHKSYEAWRALSETNKTLGLPTENRIVQREQKLWYILTTRHLALETVVRQTMRNNRGGISIDQHKGDLGWYSRMVNARKKQTRAQRDIGSRALARLGDCEGFLDDEDDIAQTQVSGWPRRDVETTATREGGKGVIDNENMGRRSPCKTKRHWSGDATDEGSSCELAEISGNKRQRCMADKCEFESDYKRQRRLCRSI
ncbi:uncharacterized protein CTRU02_213043 [Colletotrichum truncatum]|uniref:Uncharacterized protein n=1 Tax=Colletotrichum truncatum TaxID=5467 RepID=A0ACC3YJK7_COLTU|nr:uncharacterized protein CTRU02_03364 [Colletotrichum truncatum]KAF6797333.1 hypothetical protein CTRU02_03364 [Colletotrichum truncatum]